MNDVTVPDIRDDLSELTLAQARLFTALDDAPVLRSGPPRAVVVVDATTSMGEYLPSRRVTLEVARRTLKAMFEAASQLEVQVVYFRGDECRASRWFTDPEEAARTIAGIEHSPRLDATWESIQAHHPRGQQPNQFIQRSFSPMRSSFEVGGIRTAMNCKTSARMRCGYGGSGVRSRSPTREASQTVVR